MKKKILVGTSGYNYQHWKEVFYPPNLASKEWLQFYYKYFNTVELNVTFYRLPSEKSFQGWYKRTPEDFKFVIKGSRFITHIKRIKDCRQPLKLFFNRAGNLKGKLLCVLWQLPPSLGFDLKRLSAFLRLIRENYSFCLHSFEFREKSWFNNETYDILKENNINLCIADSPNFPAYEIITSPLVYLRFHGPTSLYGSEYSRQELKLWADKAKEWLKNAKLLVAFFNNDAHGYAVKNALAFKKLVDERL